MSSDFTMLGEEDLYLFNEGTHRFLGERLGCHLLDEHHDEGHDQGAYFAVWAPNARGVSVIGEFNGWLAGASPLRPRASSGIFEGTVAEARHGQVYKYAIETAGGDRVERADPYAIRTEEPPRTGSVVWDLAYTWHDGDWLSARAERVSRREPMSVYEVHLGSWRRDPARPDEVLGYSELAPLLVDYVVGAGFTHVELLPVMEHPFYGSWGYQVTSYFAPSARYGTPQELMGLVDTLHQAGIGVIFDWVPSHFPTDAFALSDFDGTALYEHADPRRGLHPDWNTAVFNYGRHEVRSFLHSSAEHWLGRYHGDGLRVDAVASMLYLDYSRAEGGWEPNPQGGREDLDAIAFLQTLNSGIYAAHPSVDMIAEESTAWPGVSRPVDFGGLGFGYKWDMGWMHDTLEYFALDPVHRRYHHDELTKRGLWAFSENYVVALSHDEVTHGKRSLLSKMPGDRWQQFANLRLLLGYQWTQPGKKLLFMGDEFGQWSEWDHDVALDWPLLGFSDHLGILAWVSDLNAAYRAERALHELDTDPSGFSWVLVDDAETSVLAYLRWSSDGEVILVACNMTPVPRPATELRVPRAGFWRELLNSDAAEYGGSGMGNLGGVEAVQAGAEGAILSVSLPPLACVVLRHEAT